MSSTLRILVVTLLSTVAFGQTFSPAADPDPVDLVIYGGTSSGVAAAVQAKRMGMSVVLIEPTERCRESRPRD